MRCLSRLALLVLFTFSGMARATDFVVPVQSVKGAEVPIAVGELADLSVSPPNKTANWSSASYSWKVIDISLGREKVVRSYDGVAGPGSGVFFGTGMKPKKLVALCAITHLFIVRDGDTSAGKVLEIGTRTVFLSVDVTIGDPSPEPGPLPVPVPVPPTPVPVVPVVLPDGKYKLAQISYNTASSKVASATRAKESLALATSFRGIASAIAAGTLTDPKDILAKTTASNLASLKTVGGVRDNWVPFFSSMEDVIYQLYADGKISTAADFAAAWGEVALGLESIK